MDGSHDNARVHLFWFWFFFFSSSSRSSSTGESEWHRLTVADLLVVVDCLWSLGHSRPFPPLRETFRSEPPCQTIGPRAGTATRLLGG